MIEQTVAGGEPQTVTVPAYSYDYGQPIDTQSTPPPAEVADPALAKFDSARAAFGTGDYAGALRLTDEALKVLPNDATLHEFRALVLFAVGKYDLAAGPLYAVLSVGPGWDWTTMAGLYPDVDVYTSQLRKLEAFVTANPASTAARFVLAYHYLTQGNTDAAVSQLKGVVALAPRTHSRPSSSSSSRRQPASEHPDGADCCGTGDHARQARQSDRKLDCPPRPRHDDRPAHWRRQSFTWRVTAKGKPRQLAGKWSLADDLLTLARKDRGGRWSAVSPGKPATGGLSAYGDGSEDQGLLFSH